MQFTDPTTRRCEHFPAVSKSSSSVFACVLSSLLTSYPASSSISFSAQAILAHQDANEPHLFILCLALRVEDLLPHITDILHLPVSERPSTYHTLLYSLERFFKREISKTLVKLMFDPGPTQVCASASRLRCVLPRSWVTTPYIAPSCSSPACTT